jgi:hypothetical protein
MTTAAFLQPLRGGDLAAWHGLPPLPADAFDATLGAPAIVAEAELGGLPAERRAYGDVIVWARAGAIVMVEFAGAWRAATLDALESPCAILPNEILVQGGYAHEYLFCVRGLVATVVRPHDGGANRIVRLRGIAPIAAPDEFARGYYQAFEDRIRWDTDPAGSGS